MENRNLNPTDPNEEQWLDDVLGEAAAPEEIGMDEQAVSSAGLRHPDKLHIDNILAENWDTEEPIDDPASGLDLQEGMTAGQTGNDYLPDANRLIMGDEINQEAHQTPPASEEKKDAPQRKRRPKMKKGYGLLGIPHILATGIWLAIILAVGVSLGRTLWLCCADLMAFGKADQKVTITITDADDIDSISQKLGKANLVRYPGLFKTFAEITGKDENISVGTFTLNAKLDYNAMINAMGYYGSAREDVDVLIPEGYNCAQIFRTLEENNVCTVEELEQWAAEGELDEYWFLKDVDRGDKYCLEGYLAPDTYTFYTNDEPKRVLEKFLDEFDDRFTDIMRQDLEQMQQRYAEMLAANGFDENYIQENALTLHKALTLASIVQKETSGDLECYDIASVFYNRVTDPANYPFLDSDATVYYAIGDYFGDTRELSAQQLDTDSPYNTRNHQGLPPGPICNPGTYALYAALDPNETNYHYFVYDKTQYKHQFSETYNGHLSLLEELGL